MPSDSTFSFFWLVTGVVTLGFVLVVGHLLVTTVRNLRSPVLRRSARVVGKRQSTSTAEDGSTTTTCYVTFENDAGERKEFVVKDREFHALMEGDLGNLSTQGTWFLSFARPY